MKRLLLSLLAGIALLGFGLGDAAYASSYPTLGMPPLPLIETAAPPEQSLITHLETEILPQMEQVFNPEQWEQFQANIAEGMSFRKAFKSLTLTPEQKAQMKTVLNSTYKKDALATLTPDQKKQLFLKKKELFMPTAEEVAEKIEAGLASKGLELPAEVKDKIDAGLKMKGGFGFSPDAIANKIKASMSALKEQIAD